MKSNRLTKRKRIKVSKVVIYLILIGCAFVTLFPFWYLLVASVTSGSTFYANGGIMLWPKGLDFSAYAYMFSKGWKSPIIDGYKTTILITVLGTAISMVLSTTLAYALSRRNLPGKNAMMMLVFFTTIFSSGLIPSYLLVNALKLNNKLWAYIIPNAVNAFNVIVMRNFFQSIPYELEEAAKIDGASDIAVFVKVILPMSAAGLATIGLFYAVAYWNEWFTAVLYIRKQSLWPLQMFMRQILIESDISSMENHAIIETMQTAPPPTISVKGATTIATSLPILALYPFLQKYFVKGMTMGSLKG